VKYLNSNPLQPILEVKPGQSDTQEKQSRFRIRIIPGADEGVFLKTKLEPWKNCVRATEETESQTEKASATPFYNASLCLDLSIISYLKFTHSTAQLSPSFKDACILGKVWLRQRGFSSTLPRGGFGHVEWALCLAIMLQPGTLDSKSLLNPRHSPYQLFKSALQFFANRDLVAEPYYYQHTSEFKGEEDIPLFYDGTTSLNLLFKMTPWSYKMLRAEATKTLEMFNRSKTDTFDKTFIDKLCEPLEKYDVLFQVQFLESNPKQLEVNQSGKEGLPISRRGSYRLYRVLETALQDRATQINLWPSNNTGKVATFTVGLILNPTESERLVDKGPSADLKEETATFRKFWGEKSELRRFKDGSILESLNWKSQDGGRSVIQQIVRYAIQRHFGDDIANTISFQEICFEPKFPDNFISHQRCMLKFQQNMSAFDDLANKIRELREFPLQIRQILPSSSYLRYTSTSNQPLLQEADIILQFESSGKWPEDIVAIHQMKVAVLCKLAESLNLDEEIVADVGLENEGFDLHNQGLLHITYRVGFRFRLRIQHDREASILQQKTVNIATSAHDREAYASALAHYDRVFVHSPVLTQMMRSACTRHFLLSPTIRLLKAWLGSHLLLDQFDEEVVELIAADTFLNPYPWQIPSSLTSAFVRTLNRLSRWDWRSEPLVLDFGDGMTSRNYEQIRTSFEARRRIDPDLKSAAFFIATNHDDSGVTWTRNGPSKVVATRMVALAGAAIELIFRSTLEIPLEVCLPDIRTRSFWS
jgi:U3 small nucleolar RNA-associated protein 22